MDVIADVLQVVRLRGSVFFRAEISSPWGFDFGKISEPRFHAILNGSAMVQTAKMDTPIQLQHGDLFVVPRGDDHWIGDTADTQRIPSEEASEAARQGQSFVDDTGPSCQLLCGVFAFDHGLRHPIIDLLPDYIHIASPKAGSANKLVTLARLIDEEKRASEAGAAITIDRLCEVLLLGVLREHMKNEAHLDGFLAALQDPRIGTALAQIHQNPNRAWKLDTLARVAGLSRAAFAASSKT